MVFKIKEIVFFLLILFSSHSYVYSEVFKWVDKEGKTNFTDDYLNVPTEYRNQSERRNAYPRILENLKEQKPLKKEGTLPVEDLKSTPPDKDKSEGTPGKNGEKVSLMDKLVPDVDEDGNAVFKGKVKNNGRDILNSVEITLIIEDFQGKTLETVVAPVRGKLEGVLQGEEVGTFAAQSKTPIAAIGAYKCSIAWKSFSR